MTGKQIVDKTKNAIIQSPWLTVGQIAHDMEIPAYKMHKAFNKHSDLTADGFRRAEIQRQIMEARS